MILRGLSSSLLLTPSGLTISSEMMSFEHPLSHTMGRSTALPPVSLVWTDPLTVAVSPPKTSRLEAYPAL